MPGSSNFLQHNPTEANQESDATYSTDTLRTGGIPVDAILPSAWLNKVWYQSSTAVAALMQMLAAKGFTVSDANLNTLAAVLASILTTADMPLPTGYGGTGAVSLAAAGIPQIIDKFDLTGVESNLSESYPALVTGHYRVTVDGYIAAPTVASSLSISIGFHGNGGVLTAPAMVTSAAIGQTVPFSFSYSFYANGGTLITVATTWTGGSSGGQTSSYELHIRLEEF